jgi:hypothetical protein
MLERASGDAFENAWLPASNHGEQRTRDESDHRDVHREKADEYAHCDKVNDACVIEAPLQRAQKRIQRVPGRWRDVAVKKAELRCLARVDWIDDRIAGAPRQRYRSNDRPMASGLMHGADRCARLTAPVHEKTSLETGRPPILDESPTPAASAQCRPTGRT